MLIKLSSANERRIKRRFKNCLEVVEFDYCWLLIEIRKQISSIYVIVEIY